MPTNTITFGNLRQLFEDLGERPMTDLNTYTTSELARLSSLTAVTCEPGEFFTHYGISAHMRIENDWCVTRGGSATKATNSRCRRVRSFTDLTEVDPSVSAMQAELSRRKAMDAAAAVYTMGDTVRWHGNTYRVTGILRAGSEGAKLSLARTDGWLDVLADPREVTKVEPPKPQPIPGQVYRHRETTDERPANTLYSLYRVNNGRLEYQEYTYESWKPAMLKSLAEFHREVANGTRVPYTPPVISNATHAGRRVRYAGDTNYYYPTSAQNGRVLDARANELVFAGMKAIGTREGSGPTPSYVTVALDSGLVLRAHSRMLTLLD